METWPYRSENVPSGCILVNIDGEPVWVVWVRESAWSGAGGTLRDDELIMAVIEAAKALGIIRLLADARDGRDFTTEQCRALRDFEGAVEALQEARDGG